ncbi:MAG: hypothetical protein HQL65_08705 [Magnetococcales bacterium]|nr:hypothetical protein [Magnetococcales bacterium]
MERIDKPVIRNRVLNQSINEFELVVKSLNALFKELGKQYLECVPEPPRKNYS